MSEQEGYFMSKTHSLEFKEARRAFKNVIVQLKITGSPIVFRDAVRAAIAMHKVLNRTLTQQKAEQLVYHHLNKGYHPFGRKWQNP